MSMISFSAGGINVAEIVAGLMQAERMPLATIQNRQAAVRLQVTALNAVKNGLTNLRAQALSLETAFSTFTATSSNPAVTAAVAGSAPTGSLSFSVDRVAQTHGLRTAGTVATANSPITSAQHLALSSTAGALGIGSVKAGAGLAAGALDITVTQATTAATRIGAATVAPTTIGTGNNSVELEIDGAARTITIADGTYSAIGLVQALNDGLVADGSHARAHLDNAGRVVISTTNEGSAASLRVSGGTALAALGLGIDATAVNGTDGVVSVGTESVTVSSTTGGPLTIDTGAGQLELSVTSGLRIGTAKVAVVDVGDGSVSSVASAINAAKIGASAAAVRITDGAWTLQLSAGTSGTGGQISIASDAFTGGLVETSAAQDAQITVGSGPGAYSITGRGNTFHDVMPGVVLTTSAVSTTPVTVDVGRDAAGTAEAVKALIDRANILLTQIATQTKSEPGSSGPLVGQNAVRQLANDVRNAVMSVVPGPGVGYASSVGISLTREGKFSFDQAAFLAALSDDPDAVARLFGKGGTGTGGVQFAGASDKTDAGTYTIEITTPATRATSAVVLTGGQPGTQQLSVRVGSTVIDYETTAGASATEIADGLRVALAAAGLGVTAEVDGTGVRLRSTKYGSTGNFEVSTTPGDWVMHTGTSVSGTIDGQAAIGLGNELRLLDTSTSGARGLRVVVDEGATGPAEFTYQPGVAARVVSLETRLTSENGSLTMTGKSLDARISSFNKQVDRFEERMVRLEARLVRQWSSIQTMLQSLQNQGDWLGGQIAAMSRPSR